MGLGVPATPLPSPVLSSPAPCNLQEEERAQWDQWGRQVGVTIRHLVFGRSEQLFFVKTTIAVIW